MESNWSRSSASRMKCCGISAERGCYIFSIINAVAVSICLAGSIYYIGWVIYAELHRTNDDGLKLAVNEILCIILSVSSAVAFIFAVILCYGARKKRPAFILTYFVYGILVEIASIAGAIAFLILTFDGEDLNVEHTVIGSVALIGCAVYIFPLVLVLRAWVTMRVDAAMTGEHAKLNARVTPYDRIIH